MRTIRIYKSGIHLGEERIVDGNQNSGMIYFSGCHLACNFCYTPETSVHYLGTDYSADGFSELVDELVLRGARNLNLVSPTHLWTQIKRPLLDLKLRYGRLLPLVLKISGYESQTLVRQMASLTDIFVPDFKVWSPEVATALNLPTNYGQTAQAALQLMMKTHGDAHFTAAGKITHGVLVRHLMMPNYFEDSLEIVSALGRIGFTGHLNLMTYYLDPALKKVVNASPEQVSLLSHAAQGLGMKMLVNGKLSERISPPLTTRTPVKIGRSL